MSATTAMRPRQRHVEHCMGTVFSFDIIDCEVVDLADVLSWLHWVDEVFSTYKPSSQIGRLGRNEIALEDCAAEVREILSRCSELQLETHGYFSAYAAGSLEPSGLVKGWAIQRASELLRSAGSPNHCINGGGDVQTAGSSSAGQPWRIGIAHPLQPGMLAGVAVGNDLAVATSGSAERGAHIIDPHSGSYPAELISVTLVGRSLATVDAYATAAFAMGAGARSWIEDLPDVQGLIVYPDGTTWSSLAPQA